MANKKTIEVGDLINIQMLESKRSKKPVGRAADGRMCLLDKTARGYYEYDSLWLCEVIEVRPACIIMKPTEELSSAAYMHTQMKESCKQLSKKYPTHGRS